MHLSKPASLWLTPALIVALGVVVLLFDPMGWESGLANRLFDTWQRHLPLAARAGPAPPVVALDLPALDEAAMARAVRTLAKAGVKTVVLAALPTPEPSPRQLITKLPPDATAARDALSMLPEPGAAIAAAAQGLNLVVTADPGRPGPPPTVKARFVYRGTQSPFGKVPRLAEGAGGPEPLDRAAAGIGAAALIPDGDGVVRRVPIALRLGASLVPSLAAETLRVLHKQPAITVTTDSGDPLTLLRGVGIAALETTASGPGPIPAAPDGTVWLRWGPVAHISATAAADLAGAIAVIGPSGTAIATPQGPDSLAGVTANALRTLLADAAPARPPWLHLAEALILALLGYALVLALQLGSGWAAAMVAAALPLLFYGAWFAFARGGLLIDVLTPAIALALALAAEIALRINRQRVTRASLRLAFADSLPRATIEKIARRPSLLTVEGQTRTVTYLACGVRGLAELAAGYREDAAAFTRLMQQVLTPLIDQALAHGGTIDRLTADGFTAFWNAPLDDAEHALHACEAASGMSIASSRIAERIAQGQAGGNAVPPVEIGVGLATGQVIAGGFGGYGRMGYSVNGDAVILAQRIQAQSHQYGPSVIAAAVTRQAADRAFAWLEVDTIAAGAKDPPVTLYAMAGNPVMRASPKFRALTVFHNHIFQAIRKQQWGMARELIAQCRRLSGASQKMYDLHLARIAWYEKHPPAADWDGAFRPVLE
jgi:adenylate cyclase